MSVSFFSEKLKEGSCILLLGRVKLDLPKAKTAEDVNEAVSAVLGALARQEITPSEAQAVVSILEVQRKAIETVDLEARVRALENGEL